MTINRIEEEGKLTLQLEGWLDVETVGTMKEAMAEKEIPAELIFDFGKLEYIASLGIREIVAAYKKQKGAGGTFKIINVQPDILSIFKMTGLDKKLDIAGA